MKSWMPFMTQLNLTRITAIQASFLLHAEFDNINIANSLTIFLYSVILNQN